MNNPEPCHAPDRANGALPVMAMLGLSQKTFSQEIRNDLEHIDARAVGLRKKGRRKVKIGNIQDFRNFSNDNLTFNGKSYPVNKESLNRLKDFYRRTMSVIHEDYALKDAFFCLRHEEVTTTEKNHETSPERVSKLFAFQGGLNILT
jgi:hypothetical protein